MEALPKDTLDTFLIPFIHLYSARAMRALQDLSLHPGQLPILFLAADQKGATLRQLADRLHIKPPTVTVTVQRLEKAGLLEKRPDETDQRVCHIHLTPAGEEALEKAREIVLDNHRTATRGMSEEDLSFLKSCFERMSENLRQDAGLLPLSCPFDKDCPLPEKEPHFVRDPEGERVQNGHPTESAE